MGTLKTFCQTRLYVAIHDIQTIEHRGEGTTNTNSSSSSSSSSSSNKNSGSNDNDNDNNNDSNAALHREPASYASADYPVVHGPYFICVCVYVYVCIYIYV